MPQVNVKHKKDMLFETTVGSHTLTIDVPPEMKGKDRSLTPPDLFLASLASCILSFVVNYCNNVGINTEDMSVDLSYDELEDPKRFANLKVAIKIPKGDYVSHREAILRVVEQCPVYETICTVDRVETVIIKEVIDIIVFACDCQGEIGVPADLEFGERVAVQRHSLLCSKHGVEEVRKAAEEGKRVVIAGCTPRIAEKFFGRFDPEIVNIREHVSFVKHAPEKIKDLISGAVEKVRVSKGISRKIFEIKSKDVLVIGGGVAGLEVARQIVASGLRVFIVEKEPFLGGMVAKLDRLYPEGTPDSHTLYPLINDLVDHDNVEVLTQAEVEEVSGVVGDYNVKIKIQEESVSDCRLCGRCEDVCPIHVERAGINTKAIYYVPTYPDRYAVDYGSCNRCGRCIEVCPGKINLEACEKEIALKVGSIVVATGLTLFDPSPIKEYGYGKYKNVLTALEFERKVASGQVRPKKVVIINCAGSRDERYLPYCSRVCCLIGMKEAKLVKDRFPDTEVYLTHIDMRSYGRLEKLYATLRDTYGVNFIKGRPSEVIPRGGKLVVKTEDIVLGELLEIETDYVVLSVGFLPDEALLRKLGIRVGSAFPNEYENSGLSVDSNPRGIYIAGSAAYPQDVTESLIDAREVSSSVKALLLEDSVEVKTPVPEINSEICSAINCKLCLFTCPYGAIFEEDGEIKIDESVCMGCGVCTASCGAGANQLQGSTDRELLAQLRGTIKEGNIVSFLCKWSAYNASDKAGYERLNYPESARIIRVPCTGRVDTQLILEAFRLGAKGVLVGGCYPDSCHYRTGNFRARTRHALSKEILAAFGIDSKRLRIEWFGKDESQKLVDILEDMKAS